MDIDPKLSRFIENYHKKSDDGCRFLRVNDFPLKNGLKDGEECEYVVCSIDKLGKTNYLRRSKEA